MSHLFEHSSTISMSEAQAVVAHYRNVTIEDVQPAGHFRIVIRNHAFECRPMMWRYWNFAPDASADLNHHLKEDGIKACTDETQD